MKKLFVLSMAVLLTTGAAIACDGKKCSKKEKDCCKKEARAGDKKSCCKKTSEKA
ncbi:hypothetical protein ACFSQD_14785 [Flavihumibacter stibioxidans]|uniref:hypothetical protein n=1 Tax=Flavihumibacter stibioxidans TaxID=1834163 RepID=UPI00164F4A69|nr:hypothetical protein [Flavihumibacter stibioxidans]